MVSVNFSFLASLQRIRDSLRGENNAYVSSSVPKSRANQSRHRADTACILCIRK